MWIACRSREIVMNSRRNLDGTISRVVMSSEDEPCTVGKPSVSAFQRYPNHLLRTSPHRDMTDAKQCHFAKSIIEVWLTLVATRHCDRNPEEEKEQQKRSHNHFGKAKSHTPTRTAGRLPVPWPYPGRALRWPSAGSRLIPQGPGFESHSVHFAALGVACCIVRDACIYTPPHKPYGKIA